MSTYDLIQGLRAPDLKPGSDCASIIGEVYLISDLIKEADRRLARVCKAKGLELVFDPHTFNALLDGCDTQSFAETLAALADRAEALLNVAWEDDARNGPRVGGHPERGSVG